MTHSHKWEQCDLRGDGYLGPCLLLDLFQVAALFPNQPTHEAIVGKDFQRDVLRPTTTHTHTEVRLVSLMWCEDCDGVMSISNNVRAAVCDVSTRHGFKT